MIEVEIKLRIESIEKVIESLILQGFRKVENIIEVDSYFDNDEEVIRLGGQALRVRSVRDVQSGHTRHFMTFKGVKLDQISMTRQELETELSDGQAGVQILESLQYHIVEPKVIKHREIYTKNGYTACIDDVENLGLFLELEAVIEENESKEVALSNLESILVKIGYTLKDTTRTSYLSQLQQRED